MSVFKSSTGLFTNILTILYGRGSKFPKTTKKRQIWLFLTIFGPQNDQKGGEFGQNRINLPVLD